jgi:hypothetical protein
VERDPLVCLDPELNSPAKIFEHVFDVPPCCLSITISSQTMSATAAYSNFFLRIVIQGRRDQDPNCLLPKFSLRKFVLHLLSLLQIKDVRSPVRVFSRHDVLQLYFGSPLIAGCRSLEISITPFIYNKMLTDQGLQASLEVMLVCKQIDLQHNPSFLLYAVSSCSLCMSRKRRASRGTVVRDATSTE